MHLHLLALALVTLGQSPAPPPAKGKAPAAPVVDEAAIAAAAKAEHDAAEAAQRAADAEAAREAEAHAGEQAAARALEARGLEARMRVVCDALKKLPGDHREQRFAVVPFTDVGDEASSRQLGLVVSDLVVTHLARDHRLALVERAAIGKVLEEQALGQIGALADGQAAEVGKVSGARALVVGQVSDEGSAFRVTLRALDTETSAVVDGTAHDVTLPKDELIAFSTDAVVLRSKGAAMFRSLVVPGWGQAYNDEPVKAGIVGATVGTLAATTLVTAGFGGYLRFVVYDQIGTRDEDKERGPAELADLTVATRTGGETALTAAGVLAGATAIAWGVGVIDAYLSGTDVESLDAALAGR
jgi:TolB-like protein